MELVYYSETDFSSGWLVCDLNRTSIVMAKHGISCVHFSGISTYGRTSRETVSHPQRPPLPTLYKTYLPVYVIVQINGCNRQQQPGVIHWCYIFRCWKVIDVWLNIGVFCAICIQNSWALLALQAGLVCSTCLMTSLISMRHPLDVVRVGAWNSQRRGCRSSSSNTLLPPTWQGVHQGLCN